MIVLTRHKTAKTQRVPKPRVISIDAEIVKLLIAIRSRNELGELVFYNHRGTPWNRSSLSLRLQRGRKKARIPVDAKLYGLHVPSVALVPVQ